MARRSDHSREQLAGLVLDAARALAAAEGLRGVTMRSIAARIGYAAGTIYNTVGDLDAVLMRVKADTLTRLADHVEAGIAAHAAQDPVERAVAVAEAYLAFVAANMRLWSVVFEHRMPDGADGTAFYEAARARPIRIVDSALLPFFPDLTQRRRATTALWAALQGVAALAVAGSLTAADDTAHPADIAGSIVRRYLTGHEDGSNTAGSNTAGDNNPARIQSPA